MLSMSDTNDQVTTITTAVTTTTTTTATTTAAIADEDKAKEKGETGRSKRDMEAVTDHVEERTTIDIQSIERVIILQ